jgi:outer membrane protein OmpA-like peptidoglycan-associated protein
MRALFPALVTVCLAAACASTATAEPLRLHAGAGAAHAFTGHQKDELGFGATGLGAAELPLTRELGVQLELGALWLSQGSAPKDPTLARGGSATAYTGGIGLRVRPFAGSYRFGKPLSAAGLWAAGSGGVAATGGLARGMLDAQLGFDLLYERGKLGVGPMLGYLHVFQPNDALRPDDANIAILGVHVMWDTARHVIGDRDHDGIKDNVDKCPDDPEDKDGFQDADGCPDPDNDKDGIPDKVDHCPNVPEDVDGFQDQDGCPDPDNDKDGIPDKVDQCPNEPEDVDGFQDEDGCPDPDNDKDGIPDKEDLCPNEPETKNGYADDDGCPDEEQVRVIGDKIVLDDRVHFRVNSWIIRPVSYPLLNHLTKLLADHPEYVHIDVQGHADERGPASYNKRLSAMRAKAVLEYLVKHGIKESRLSYQGFGSSRPLVKKNSEHAWFLNRRVEFKVTREVKKVIHKSEKPAKPGARPEKPAQPQGKSAAPADKPGGGKP